jgi:hypothetical protein
MNNPHLPSRRRHLQGRTRAHRSGGTPARRLAAGLTMEAHAFAGFHRLREV